MLDVLWSVASYERLVVDWELDPQDAVAGVTWVIGLVEEAVRSAARRVSSGISTRRPGHARCLTSASLFEEPSGSN